MMGIVRLVAELLVIPLVLALLLCLVGLVFRWRRRRGAARASFAVAAASLYLFSTYPVANLLLGRLESQYPPLVESAVPPPGQVAVLGSGYMPRDTVPVTAALDADGLARIVEGVRLLRRWPDTSLIVSGGPAGPRSPARGYERLALDMGVAAGRIQVLDHPGNTSSEALAIASLARSGSLVLVTSAFHMPRAMSEMKRQGLHPLAAPTAHRVDSSVPYGVKSLVPNAGALKLSEFALREYLALFAASLGIGA